MDFSKLLVNCYHRPIDTWELKGQEEPKSVAPSLKSFPKKWPSQVAKLPLKRKNWLITSENKSEAPILALKEGKTHPEPPPPHSQRTCRCRFGDYEMAIREHPCWVMAIRGSSKELLQTLCRGPVLLFQNGTESYRPREEHQINDHRSCMGWYN